MVSPAVIVVKLAGIGRRMRLCVETHLDGTSYDSVGSVSFPTPA